mmetsp:Transcript_52725/g.133883  ORF Transcript_52725/g.133883 Transcript_52725/m.133883 type:complete len:128 (+) Transcript_52725:44-427(+)
MERLLSVVAGTVGLAVLVWWLLRADGGEQEDGWDSRLAEGRGKPKANSSAETLDLDDLDEDERRALAEVSKKGYYHGRPKSQAAPAPQRLSGGAAPEEAPQRRAEFDEFQKKWDRFDNDSFVGDAAK